MISFTFDRKGYLAARRYLKDKGFNNEQMDAVDAPSLINTANQRLAEALNNPPKQEDNE